ncbi:MAG: CIA30 family protein [Treponema sp.]|nr:CIA30 family protein [Treponema sp.]
MILRKKSLVFAALFLAVNLFSVSLIAEESEKEKEPARYQFIQQFKWTPTEKGFRYEIKIESFEDGQWVPEVSEKTSKTNIQLPLSPGRKRVSIVSLNRLGRRGQQTEWSEFVVLGETQPYLYADYLKKSKQWNSPLLMVTHAETDDLSENVESEKGDPENSFFLKGKNIFLTETKFYMVPVEESSSGGKRFQAFNSMRSVVPLNVVRHDFERPGVVVSYNPDELFSGYYQIFAENPGNQKTSLDILVLANRVPEFDKEQFPYYANYDVNILDTDKIQENGNLLRLTGSGFTGDTTFALNPSTEGIPYPFSTSKDRKPLELSVQNMLTLNGKGDMELTFKVNPKDLRPGYYNLVAENAMGSSSVRLLVKHKNEEEYPVVTKIKSEKGGKEDLVLTLKGKGLTPDSVFTLVSTMSDVTGINVRIPFQVVDSKKNGKKIVIQGKREKIVPGTYGILIEPEYTSVLKLVEFDLKLNSSIAQAEEEKIEEEFIRPENFVASVSEEEQAAAIAASVDELDYQPNEFKVARKPKVFFPYTSMDVNLAEPVFQENSVEKLIETASLKFSLLNFDWLRIGNSYTVGEDYIGTDLSFNLAVPVERFRPYVGIGAGYNVYPEYFISSDWYSAGSLYGFARAGVVLLDFFDINYTLTFNALDKYAGFDFTQETPKSIPFFYDSFSIGAHIPLRSPKYVQKPINTTLTINREGLVNGTDYELQKNIKKLVFSNGVREIRSFTDHIMLTDVVLPDTVKVIGKDAFRGCFNLENIIIPEGVVEIGDGAFAGCKSMRKIVLPSSIRKISSTAFDGWEDYQYVVYKWNKDDEVQRDLGGLQRKSNFTQSEDLLRTPFEASNIFSTWNEAHAAVSKIERVEYIDNKPCRIVRLGGRTKTGDWDNHFGIEVWGNQQINRYLKNADGIRFKVRGDNNVYEIRIMSPNNETAYAYSFYAPLNATEIEIPFSKFRICDYSKKKIKMNEMKIEAIGFYQNQRIEVMNKKFQVDIYDIETFMRKKK